MGRRVSEVSLFGAALIAIVIVACLLRFQGLTARELWLDESCTSYWVHNFTSIDDALSPWNEPAHVSYFFLLRLWTRVFGETEWGLRSFSAVVGSLTVGLLGVLAARVANYRVGLFTAILAAVHPLHIYYSQEARSYVLWVFAITAATYFLMRAAKSSRIIDWIGYVICTCIAFLTHYYTLFWIPVTFAAWFLCNDKRRFVRQWMSAAIVIGLLLIAPAWFWMRPYLQTGPTSWQHAMWESYPPWLAIPRSIWALLPSGGYPRAYLGPLDYAAENVGTKAGAWALVFLQWVPTALLFVMLGLWFLHRKSAFRIVYSVNNTKLPVEKSQTATSLIKFAAVMGLGYLLIVWVCALMLGRGYLVGRYDLAAWPALLFVLALLVELVCSLVLSQSLRSQKIAAYTVMGAMVACSCWTMAGYRGEQIKNEAQERARRIAAIIQPQDLVISVGMYRWFLDHEWRSIGFSPEVRSFPSWHDRQLCWRDVPSELADPSMLQSDLDALMTTITTALTDKRRVWLLWQPDPEDPTWTVDGRLLQALQEKRVSIRPEDDWVGIIELRLPPPVMPGP